MNWIQILSQAAVLAPALIPTLLRSLADYLEQHPETITQLLTALQPKPAART